MTGWVQRDSYSMNINRLTVGDRGYRGLISEPSARHSQSVLGHKVLAAAPAEMISVCVSNHGAFDHTPGVDEEAPLFTVETHVCHSEQWVFVQVHVSIIDTTRARPSPPFLLSIE